MVSNKEITVDPETGYMSKVWTGFDYGADVRCVRCKGRGMWQPGPNDDPLKSELVLCLKCANEWHQAASPLLDKYGYIDARSGKTKWLAAYNEFLQTKPLEIDLEAHNARIKARNRAVRNRFPEYSEYFTD